MRKKWHNKGLAKIGIMYDGTIERAYSGLKVAGKKPCLMGKSKRHSLKQTSPGIWVVTRRGKVIK